MLPRLLLRDFPAYQPVPSASRNPDDDSTVETSKELTIDHDVAKRLHALWSAIVRLPPGAERDEMLDDLESVPPPGGYFYGFWLRAHNVSPPDNSWANKGFDPSKSPLPRDVQILAAVSYGMNDIENGGLHQFFWNSTGQFAPEMAEWFERVNMPDAAKVFKDGMAVFGDVYPRSQKVRDLFLDEHPQRGRGETRKDWDPFYNLDIRLDVAAPDIVIRLRADAWLSDICCVRHLRERPTH